MQRLASFAFAFASVVSFATAAQAQYGAPPPAPPPYAQPAPAPQPTAYAVTTAPQPKPEKPVSGFIGPRLTLEVVPEIAEDISFTTFTPSLEGGIWIVNRVELYLAFGTVVYGTRAVVDPGDEIDDKVHTGNLLFQFGGRFHITEPEPGRAFLYTGIDLTWIAGIAKHTTEGPGDDPDYDEEVDAAKELIDRFGVGIELGVEYLVTDNFGIGAEAGLRLYINNLKDTWDEDDTGIDSDDVNKYRVMWLQVPFTLRFMYHF